ncbi:MAG TPA: 50S ribosomal protein L31 [Chloroflexi bacterium]|nr:MAG: 50S ribosomal protein L31 [Chloroflexota bacterium]HDD55247.1 50S ribosomal protein L31 [Chloroflexota bacterium]
MKEDIQPKYYPEATVVCACGNTWKTGSTQETIRTDVCSACHPFFTGEQRIVDSEGQVDRFYKKLKVHEDYQKEKEARETQKATADVSVEVLDLGARVTNTLLDAKIVTVADLLALLEGGEQPLLDIKGFGRKSLIDLKKALRAQGFEIPEAAEEITV